ncbi:MAG: arginine--tRNA ligase, partial [Chloroflexota bacterium]|nr:arginine--tRNA ligase [Chloroflexota bacterium]
MNIRSELKNRFRAAVSKLTDNTDELLEMVRQSQDAKFGDYQANFAMPLGKRLGRPPREVAAEIIEGADVSDFCQEPEIAGPGFINLRVRDDWLIEQLAAAVNDPRLGVAEVAQPRRYVIDYSAPNVAKPMHVGHIRSTVIGDSLCRVLRFLGHDCVSDNHIGDWGTQFGMIIYGWRNFLDAGAYDAAPVAELARLYRLVRQLVDYHAGKAKLPELEEKIAEQEAFVKKQQAAVEQNKQAAQAAGKKPDKKLAKSLRKAENDLNSVRAETRKLREKLAAVDDDPELAPMAAAHEGIGTATLRETAKLHAGDADNLRLWNEFLPNCQDEINRVYGRLGISFDHTLGESFYNDRLSAT